MAPSSTPTNSESDSVRAGTPVVEFRDVHVVFGNVCVLDIEKLSILPGERVFILGRSGSGKTTLARLIKGRLAPSTGEVRVMGHTPNELVSSGRRAFGRRVAMIDQEFHLVPRLTVGGNILTGALGRVPILRSLIGWFPRAELARAEEIAEEVEMSSQLNQRADSLSGGQRQRTGIGRALMQEAEIILADEPISNLDPELAEDALELLDECVRRRGVSLIVNLHQPALARRFASRIIGLSAGKIVYDGPAAEFTEDRAQFLYQAPGDPEVVELKSEDIS